jgi:hypothetical protein
MSARSFSASEQRAGQSHLRPFRRLPTLGEHGGVTDHGRQRRVVLPVMEVVRLGVLGEVDANACDVGGQAVQEQRPRGAVDLPSRRIRVAQQSQSDGQDPPAGQRRIDLQHPGDGGRQEGETDEGFER